MEDVLSHFDGQEIDTVEGEVSMEQTPVMATTVMVTSVTIVSVVE